MQTILIVYCLGLVFCVAVGVVLSLVVFRDVETIVSPPAPRQAALPLARIIKLSFILAALAGGISARFYGCKYVYADIVDNPTALTLKVFGQVEGTLRWLLVFLLIFAGVVTVAAAIWRATRNRSRA